MPFVARINGGARAERTPTPGVTTGAPVRYRQNPRLVRFCAGVATFLLVLAGGCSFDDQPDDKPDIDKAASFQAFPLYWLGESFEGHDIETIGGLAGEGSAVVLTYGTCDISGFESSCASPVQLQISPLCDNLISVTRSQIWRTRTIRGAPVGTEDNAPVLYSRRIQIKVYRGEGTDSGSALRAIAALRSLNREPPVISASDPIPPPAPGILGGDRVCTD
jgi:hypothetical protein